jgi:hypothetical protein
LVNKIDLRVLTIRNTTQWPEPPGQNEIHEGQLLRDLGKDRHD